MTQAIQTTHLHVQVNVCRYDGAETPKCAPMVVPATLEEYGKPGWDMCDMTCTFIESDSRPDPGINWHRRTRMTCADKRRVLVTTEDGLHLCILFPDAATP